MASVVVELEARSLERVDADLVVVGVSPDDRPLRGAAGRADWRLCGEVWQLVAARKFNGALGEAALLSAAGPLRSPMLLIVGLGHRAELAVDRWRELGSGIVRRALDLQANRVVMGLASDAADLGAEGTRALFAGAVVAAGERNAEIHLVVAGEEASARRSELQSLADSELPVAVSLKLPEAPEKSAHPPVIQSGGFSYSESLRFK